MGEEGDGWVRRVMGQEGDGWVRRVVGQEGDGWVRRVVSQEGRETRDGAKTASRKMYFITNEHRVGMIVCSTSIIASRGSRN